MRVHARGIQMVLVVLFVLGGFGATSAQEIHSLLCLRGCPVGGASTDDLIIREIYVLRSNDRTKLAEWVAYRVTAETIGPSPNRNWRQDPLLRDDETLHPDDYIGAHARLGTDRGHQVPLASVAGTPYAQETNYLSNITPQQANLNQGPWARLEEAERALARSAEVDAVYVLTGPLFERPITPLPQARRPHLVPSGYWKIVAVSDAEGVRAAAFIMEQETPRSAAYCARQVALGDVESRSTYRFFHALDGPIEDLAPELGC
jgi:endonuclease G, mitochondrial